MNEHTLECLEFGKLQDFLKKLCISPLGMRAVGEIKFSEDTQEIRDGLALVSEARQAVDTLGPFPLSGAKEIYDSLDSLEAEGAFLSSEELLNCLHTLKAVQGTRDHFLKAGKGFRRLVSLANLLCPLPEVVREIERCLSPAGDILDGASDQLRRVRARIKTTRTRIIKELEGMLTKDEVKGVIQDSLVTLRQGRYVIPVKPGFKKYLPAVVHDHSASGVTLYVEPLAILPHSNALAGLLKEEKEEERRVLVALTRKVAAFRNEIRNNLSILAEVDLIGAKARLSHILDATLPEVSERGDVKLIQCRHPFLILRDKGFSPKPLSSSEKTVPIDIILQGQPVLIISGVNTGGKTVALKTLGLLALMVRAQMYIPAAEGSTLAIFKKIFVDLGDDQQVEGNLSSFSCHVLNLTGVLSQADASSLVLLDELGSSTDPAEGAALGLAILLELKDKGAKVLVTTHLPGLVRHGLVDEAISLAAVGFDEERLAPTYKLAYGLPGASHAFSISRRLGLPEPVVEKAERLISKQEEDLSRLLNELAASRNNIEEEHEELQRARSELSRLREKREQRALWAERTREEILEKYRNQVTQLLEKAQKEINSLIHSPEVVVKRKAGELKQIKAKFMAAARGRKRPRPVKELTEGEEVLVLSLDKPATVLKAWNQRQEALLQMGNLRVVTPFSDLGRQRREACPSEGKPSLSQPLFRAEFEPLPSNRLVVIGLRMEEALPKVEKFIDTALACGQNMLEIVHGHGSGRLGKGIRQFLQNHPRVGNIKNADPGQGGTGVTVVEISE